MLCSAATSRFAFRYRHGTDEDVRTKGHALDEVRQLAPRYCSVCSVAAFEPCGSHARFRTGIARHSWTAQSGSCLLCGSHAGPFSCTAPMRRGCRYVWWRGRLSVMNTLALRITPSAHAHPASVPPRASLAENAPRLSYCARPVDRAVVSPSVEKDRRTGPRASAAPGRRTNAVRATIGPAAHSAARDDDAE